MFLNWRSRKKRKIDCYSLIFSFPFPSNDCLFYSSRVPAGPEEYHGWIGYLTKAVSASANYLPTQVTDVFNQGRAFASVHLPFQGIRNVCAITT